MQERPPRSDGERTVISMLNDCKGDPREFALVVPVPQVLWREQIHIGDKRLFERVDAYSAPRLADYYDADPCARREMDLKNAAVMAQVAPAAAELRAKISRSMCA